MLPYWLLFLVPTIAALSEREPGVEKRRLTAGLTAFCVLLTLMIGLRFEVGGDWFTYESIFRYHGYFDFWQVLERSDPGYGVLNWWANTSGFDTTLVNTICGAIFAIGLITFAKRQPLPWLAIAVAVPYLVIVVAMGYTRQGVAIGCAMVALAGLGAGSTLRFAIWVGIAATFHKSAVLLIPIAILANTKGRIWTIIWVGALAILLYQILLAESVDRLFQNYLGAGYSSQGAAIRVAMNAIPGALFLLFRRYFDLHGAEKNLWTYMSLGSLGFIILLLISPSSTAVDRVALYLIPLQVFVFSRLPLIFQNIYGVGQIAQVGILIYSGLVMFVWLNFATHAQYWLPYKMLPFAS